MRITRVEVRSTRTGRSVADRNLDLTIKIHFFEQDESGQEVGMEQEVSMEQEETPTAETQADLPAQEATATEQQAVTTNQSAERLKSMLIHIPSVGWLVGRSVIFS